MTPHALGERMLHYFRTPNGEEGKATEELPSFTAFAHSLGTTVGALRRFKEQNAEFRAVWEECEELLCDRIIDGALRRRYDGSFAKFLLTARYGIADKESDTEDPFTVEILLKEPSLPDEF